MERYIELIINDAILDGGDTIYIPVRAKGIMRAASVVCSDDLTAEDTVKFYRGNTISAAYLVNTVTIANPTLAGVRTAGVRDTTYADVMFDPTTAGEDCIGIVVSDIGAYTLGVLIEMDEFALADNTTDGAPSRP